MVRIMSHLRRGVQDEHADDRVDEREMAERESVTSPDTAAGREPVSGRVADAERERKARLDPTEDLDSTSDLDSTRDLHGSPRHERTVVTERSSTVDDHPADVTEPAVVPVQRGPRPRASGLATIALIVGLLAAGAVATGVLAMPGVAAGLLGIVVAVGGIAATARRHVAGRFDALLGLLLSLAAVVVGLLALANAIVWPDNDTDQVARLADWLTSQFPWMSRF